MSSLDEVIAKIPRPLLVFVVLFFALIFIIQQNPLSDGCDVEISNLLRSNRGIISAFKDKKNRTHFSQIENLKQQCTTGNSSGSCLDYFIALKQLADSLKKFPDKCYKTLEEQNPAIIQVSLNAVKVLALLAWGDKPPESVTQRLGWLSESEIYTFCRFKNFLTSILPDEEYLKFRMQVYIEFPEKWDETISLEKRAELPRPRAWKNSANPNGKLADKEVFEKSLFSIRCDLYQ